MINNVSLDEQHFLWNVATIGEALVHDSYRSRCNIDFGKLVQQGAIVEIADSASKSNLVTVYRATKHGEFLAKMLGDI